MNKYFISAYIAAEERQIYLTNLNIDIKGLDREAGVFHQVREKNGKEMSVYTINSKKLSDVMVCEFYEISFKKQKRMLVTQFSHSFGSTEKLEIEYELATNDILFRSNEDNLVKQQAKDTIVYDSETTFLEHLMDNNVGGLTRNPYSNKRCQQGEQRQRPTGIRDKQADLPQCHIVN